MTGNNVDAHVASRREIISLGTARIVFGRCAPVDTRLIKAAVHRDMQG